MTETLKQLQNGSARITVIGGGYVGLPLALAFARAGHRSTVYDVDDRRIRQLREGRSPHRDIQDKELVDVLEQDRFEATTDPDGLSDQDAIVLCVPTPLDPHNQPDLSYVEAAARDVASDLRRGQVVSLESTTYPGTTEEVVLEILAGTGLEVGEDFHLVYSPERIDPGNDEHNLQNIPKVVGGVTPSCLEAGKALYGPVVDRIVPVSSTQVAEASKLLENIYRSVNVALVNELKVVLDRMDIDVWEVIEAAATKPFGFEAFYPGPGLGGHCLPVDPFFMAWKAQEHGDSTRFIELAGQINRAMPRYVVERIQEALNDHGKPVNGSRILLLGSAYKPDVDDVRGSPTIELLSLLKERGGDIGFHDPFVPEVHLPDGTKMVRTGDTDLPSEALADADCVVIVTDHSRYDFDRILQEAEMIVDTRNAVPDRNADHVYQA